MRSMAREHGQASKLGAVLNEAGDIVADTELLASLAPHLRRNKTTLEKDSLALNQRHIGAIIALSISTELLAIVSSSQFNSLD